MDMDHLEAYVVALGRLCFAAVCAASVGWEREAQKKSAGLRTHVLVAVGSCLYALAAENLVARYEGVDIMRLIQGALMGTGFIAGGVIFRQGTSVRGLTTAAGLWIMSAVGVSIGLGFYFLAIASTALTFAVMTTLRWMEGRFSDKESKQDVGPGTDEVEDDDD